MKRRASRGLDGLIIARWQIPTREAERTAPARFECGERCSADLPRLHRPLRQLGYGHVEIHFLLIALDFEPYLFAEWRACDPDRQIERVLDGLAVELGDHIPELHTAAVGRTALHHSRHQRAAGILDAERVSERRIHFLNRQTGPGARDFTLGL